MKHTELYKDLADGESTLILSVEEVLGKDLKAGDYVSKLPFEHYTDPAFVGVFHKGVALLGTPPELVEHSGFNLIMENGRSVDYQNSVFLRVSTKIVKGDPFVDEDDPCVGPEFQTCTESLDNFAVPVVSPNETTIDEVCGSFTFGDPAKATPKLKFTVTKTLGKDLQIGDIVTHYPQEEFDTLYDKVKINELLVMQEFALCTGPIPPEESDQPFLVVTWEIIDVD